MKRMAAALALLVVIDAHADGYESAYLKQSKCESTAEYAVMIYNLKQAKKSKPERDPKSSPMVNAIEDFAWFNATDRKDAYMGAWSKCMDWE